MFELSSGGLFVRARGVRPGNFVTFPSQQVDRTGTISIPYAGAIKAAGLHLAGDQSDIESKLSNRAIEPQAVVTLVEQNATEVAVVGDAVNGANKFRIRFAGERILDIISKAGGLRYPAYELFVTLQRNRKRATVYLPILVKNSREHFRCAR